MIYLSAGHHFKAPKPDPGAIGNGYKEADLTKELRDLVAKELKRLEVPYILDKDSETLAEYLGRIKPGSGSVVCELHFNASDNSSARGVEVIYKEGADADTIDLAKALSMELAAKMLIPDRGAKDEGTSHRGRLGLLHSAAGISILPEIAFISNATDMHNYQRSKYEVASVIALHLVAAENLRK